MPVIPLTSRYTDECNHTGRVCLASTNGRERKEFTVTTTDWTTDAKGTGQYAEVNGINLYFESHGAGRPLILLHGGLGSARCSGR